MASFERKKTEISPRQLYLWHHVRHLLLYRSDDLTCNARSPPCQGAPRRRVLRVTAQTQQPGRGSPASVISVRLVGRARTAAAGWSFSTSVTPENSTAAHTAMGEMAKHDGKLSQQYSSLPGHSCATGVSQRSLLRAATKFPMSLGFLSTASMAPGWLGMPNKGYRSSWGSVEECKDKDLRNLYTAHLYETSRGCREQPSAFAPIISAANFSFTTGFILSLFKSARL